MLSRTGLYALRAVVALASVEDRWVPASELAERLEVPPNYLSKTLHRLAGADILESRRGRGGGFRLARPADGLSVADVVDLFDRVRGAEHCLMRARPCDPDDPCAVHQEWSRWTASRLDALEETTIRDLFGSESAGPEALASRPEGATSEDGARDHDALEQSTADGTRPPDVNQEHGDRG